MFLIGSDEFQIVYVFYKTCTINMAPLEKNTIASSGRWCEVTVEF